MGAAIFIIWSPSVAHAAEVQRPRNNKHQITVMGRVLWKKALGYVVEELLARSIATNKRWRLPSLDQLSKQAVCYLEALRTIKLVKL